MAERECRTRCIALSGFRCVLAGADWTLLNMLLAGLVHEP